MKLLRKRGIVKLVVCMAVFGLAAACALDTDRVAKQRWLFFQTATGGAYDDGILTLKGVDHTIAFTDRPAREVAHVTNDEFARAWDESDDSFADDPPNAALAYDIGDTAGQAVVNLTNITVEGGKVVYAIDVLEGEVPAGPFDRVTLVIDPLGAIFPSNQN